MDDDQHVAASNQVLELMAQCDLSTDPTNIPMEVPEFYPREVPVYGDNDEHIGEIRLTDKETVRDLRQMLQNMSQTAARFRLFKRSRVGMIPIRETQDDKLARYFFRDSGDSISLVNMEN